jgi:integrative and conjugative element protein (TIGR02256 family)
MKSDGQAWAVEQLTDIAAKSNGALEIMEIREPIKAGAALGLMLSVHCAGYPREPGGISYRPRERLKVGIPSNFPFDMPSVSFDHDRYAGFPHVFWGHSICLFVAPETEWQLEDGMYGWTKRLDDWLRAGAANTLEPIGLPMHPPVAFAAVEYFAVVLTKNAPKVEPPWWHGFVKITQETDDVAQLGDWITIDEWVPGERVVPAILLPGDMPYQYPSTMAELKTVLDARGVPLNIIRLLMTMGAIANLKDKPLYFVLGAAMRGITGGEKLQHLAAWHVDGEKARELREASQKARDEGQELDQTWLVNWMGNASINWCSVLEDRPEIVVARDTGTPAEFWRGRHVAILGCGAIGSTLAILLARANVAKLQLYDNTSVKPGLLTRQMFESFQVGYTKVSATRINTRAIRKSIDVVDVHRNILSVLQDEAARGILLGADVIINATASRRVASALEHQFRDWTTARPPLASMALGHRADTAVMTLANAAVSGVAHDLDRRLKLALANTPAGGPLFDEFWPNQAAPDRLFQPEPGCSDPTFVGSAADITVLTGRMFNVLSGWMSAAPADVARGFGMRMPPAPATLADLPVEVEFAWPADAVLQDPQFGYQVRLSPAAQAQMLTWMRKSERTVSKNIETGGVLFGQIDDFLKIIWVTVASGPPPDSMASRTGFVCGTRGVAEADAELAARTRGAASFVGSWHTHPGSAPIPSTIDRGAMENLLGSPDFGGRQFLMLIIGGYAASPTMAVSLFKRDE